MLKEEAANTVPLLSNDGKSGAMRKLLHILKTEAWRKKRDILHHK